MQIRPVFVFILTLTITAGACLLTLHDLKAQAEAAAQAAAQEAAAQAAAAVQPETQPETKPDYSAGPGAFPNLSGPSPNVRVIPQGPGGAN